MKPLDLVLSKFKEPRRSGANWSARCPAHDDRMASLTISEGDDGRVLMKCMAGCDTASVCAAIGLTLASLFADAAESVHPLDRKPATNGQAAKADPSKPTFWTASDALQSLEKTRGKNDGLWKYYTADGKPFGVVVRFNQGDGKKIFMPISKVGEQWQIAGMPAPRPLYNLPAVSAAKVVDVFEGEKAADAANGIGLVGVTSSNGSQSPEKTDWEPLAGKIVRVWPDNDEAGDKFAVSVGGILSKLTPTPMVKIVPMPGLPPKGDIVEWLEDRDSMDSEPLVKLLEGYASVIRPICGDEEETLQSATEKIFEKLKRGSLRSGLLTTGIDELDRSLGGGIAYGEVVIMGAVPGHGKTACALQMVHHWTGKGIPTLILSEEMSSESLSERGLQFASEIHKDKWHEQIPELRAQFDEHYAGRAQAYIKRGKSATNAVNEIARHVRDKGVRCVVIDYAQLLLSEGKTSTERVAATSIAIRQAVTQHNVACLFLCQLNREVSKRDKFIPKITDLKDSSQLEQDADIVFMGVWPWKINAKTHPSEYQFFVYKNRNREIKKMVFDVRFEPDRMRFMQKYEQYDFEPGAENVF